MKLRWILGLVLIVSACGSADDASRVDATVTAPAVIRPVSEDVVTAAAPEIAPSVAVIAEDVAYGATDEHNLNGYIVLPADAIDVPGVIMIHEQWGLNDAVRAMARRLAGEGYAVLAIDLFAGKTAASKDQAAALITEASLQFDKTLDNMRQAHGYLDQYVLAPRIAVLGLGTGGDWSLEAGIDLGEKLDAVVMFYGRLLRDEDALARLGGQLLGIFAELDQVIDVQDVRSFRRQLRDMGKTAQVLIYPDVEPGFLNPGGDAYDHAAAEKAWDETLAFLENALR